MRSSGFWHPIYGWDHVVAMVAVGLWGAFLGSPAIWRILGPVALCAQGFPWLTFVEVSINLLLSRAGVQSGVLYGCVLVQREGLPVSKPSRKIGGTGSSTASTEVRRPCPPTSLRFSPS